MQRHRKAVPACVAAAYSLAICLPLNSFVAYLALHPLWTLRFPLICPINQPSPYITYSSFELLLACVYGCEITGFSAVAFLVPSSQFIAAPKKLTIPPWLWFS
jgi:hypothetical protein